MSNFLTYIKGKESTLLKVVITLLCCYGLLLYIKSVNGNIYVQDLFTRIDSLGVWGPALFVVAYILISGFLLPSIVFKVAAGTIFGIVTGIITISIAATISSLLKFLLARYFFKAKITKKIEGKKYSAQLNKVIEEDGFRMLMLLRNVPILNSMLLNYICGITNMKTKDFVLASFIGRLPTTFLYVYLGYLVGYTAGIDSTNPSRMSFEKILLWMGLLASVALAYYSIYLSKKVIEEKIPESK